MLFASPLDLIAARKVAKLMLLEQLNISKIDTHVLPYDEISPPLIILTGPSALKKMTLALHVVQTIPDKVICKFCNILSYKSNSKKSARRNLADKILSLAYHERDI